MYRYCLLLILVCSNVICEDCVTVNFENGFEEDFTSNYGVCVGLSAWNIKRYSSVDIESPHPRSTSFITPQAGVSCVSSFKFLMTANGTLEANVFTIPGSPFDQLTVRVFQSIDGGEDVLFGTAVHVSNSAPVWETISLIIDGHGSFHGYVTFQSLALSINTIIRIDSLRYIGPSSDKDSCVIYKEDQITTVKPPTTTESATTTTTETTSITTTTTPTTTTTLVPEENCVTANFENNFEDNFSSNYGVCVGLSTWDIKQYSSVDIGSPHPRSTNFITPQPGTSCISSFNFSMTAGGTLEVNVYTMPVSTFDQLTFRVFQSIAGGEDILVSSAFHISNSVPDWEIISMTINGNGSFEGYVTFQAWTVSTNPIIWIDSFRYIPPSFDKDLCIIYEQEITTDKPTTEAPNEDCVTANFEYNFENDFTNNYGVCVGFSPWDIKQYSTVNIESPDPKSTRFITPQTGMSCVSSFKFTITAGGTLEVNVYTIPLSPFDQLNVRVFQSVIGGDDILIGSALHILNSVPVWETINITISGYGRFEGYVTFQAWSVSTKPVIWIDSFRYIAPSFDKDLCVIYKEDEITTVEPTTTTTEATPTTTKAPNEDCVTVDFESNFESDFTNNYGVCAGLSVWDVKQYSTVGIPSPHPQSTRFIAPQTGMSCVSSFNFTITAGGTLEVNVLMMPGSPFDQLNVRVFQSIAGGDDVLIGSAIHMSNSNLTWETINMTVNGYGSFEGYVTFQAWSVSTNPVIWIDSFRYIAPSFDKDLCVIYKEDEITTVKPTTTTTTKTTTEATPTTTAAPSVDCVTVDFESNFEDDFTSDYGVCAGLREWIVEQYINWGTPSSPHPKSTRFIEAQTGISCVSSFTFTITAGGILDVNVYMIPASPTDELNITVFQSVIDGDDILINSVLHKSNSGPVWETIHMTINGYGSFKGYVTFQARSNSLLPLIFIDSFRYIAPSFDKDLCVIYKEDQIVTINPNNTTTTPTITTTEATTTTTTAAPIEDCVTVDFESNFEDDFTNNYGVCVGLFPWNTKKYSSVDIDSLHPGSETFIVPQLGLSCVSSFNFSMNAGGMLEVNIYMMSTSLVDQLTITVFQTIVGGDDVPIGRVFLNNMSSDFVPGWQTLNMTIDEPEKFDGYVTFHAMTMSSNPVIWIDSFRYIGPSSDMDSCVIYKDETTKSPTTTTTEAPNENCVTENFEYNFEDNFTNNNTECAGLSTWNVNKYSSVNINSPHPNSTSFITPQLGLSCVSSFKFTMTPGGTLEVNVYMMAATIHNQLDVTVFQSVVAGSDAFISGVSLNHQTPNFVPGWQTLYINLVGSAKFEGYVTFVGLTLSTNPMTYIDSFRYIGPSSDKDSCVIYK